MNGGKACIRKGMKRARLRKPTLSQCKDARPRDPVFLAPAAKSTPPMRQHPIPKHPQTLEVSWYRVVVEVASDDRLEPLSWFEARDRACVGEAAVESVAVCYACACGSSCAVP